MQRLIPAFFVLLYLALSLYVMAIFIPCSGYGGNGGGNTHYRGEPTRPLAYRVLIPTAIATLASLPSEYNKERITRLFLTMRDSKAGQHVLSIQSKLYWGVSSYRGLVDAKHIYQTGMTMCVVYISLLAFIGMFYRLACAVFPESPSSAYLAPIVALLWLPTFIYKFAYTYDFAELFFSSACLYFLATRRFVPYLMCFAFATFNKETSIFLFPFFIAWFYRRLPQEQFIRLLLLQGLIYFLIKGMINIYFMEVPGVSFGNFLRNNIHHLQQLNELHMVFLLSLSWLVLFRWNEKPLFLRHALWMLGANIIAYIVASFPGEYRSFYWSVPILVLLVTHTLVAIMQKVFLGLQRVVRIQRFGQPL